MTDLFTAGREARDEAMQRVEEHSPEVRVPLGNGGHALVDATDADRVLSRTWTRDDRPHTSYARSFDQATGRTLYLHRFVLGDPEGEVDHRNRNGLDNRRSNLRVCNRSLNNANHRAREGFRGVSRDRRQDRWKARITVDYKEHWLGGYATAEEAAKAYDAAAREHFGEFATLNFPEEHNG